MENRGVFKVSIRNDRLNRHKKKLQRGERTEFGKIEEFQIVS